jgi:rhamnogalacturonan endolyase
MNRYLVASITLTACLFFAHAAFAQRQMELLGRGVVAIPQGGGKAFVSWRLLGTDPDDVAFNLYRVTENAEPVKLNAEPLRDVTASSTPTCRQTRQTRGSCDL